ncbi:MAG: hypothetical protein AAF242_07835 [Bacteroidota bacterium]
MPKNLQSWNHTLNFIPCSPMEFYEIIRQVMVHYNFDLKIKVIHHRAGFGKKRAYLRVFFSDYFLDIGAEPSGNWMYITATLFLNDADTSFLQSYENGLNMLGKNTRRGKDMFSWAAWGTNQMRKRTERKREQFGNQQQVRVFFNNMIRCIQEAVEYLEEQSGYRR